MWRRVLVADFSRVLAGPIATQTLADLGVREVAEFEVMKEDVRFMLPKTIRQAMAAAEPV